MPTPILWRHAIRQDALALSILGGATFLASFAHDHPGDALVDHIAHAHSVDFYDSALADPEHTILIGESPLGAPVGYAMMAPPDLPIPTNATEDVELKRLYLLSPWQGGNGDVIMEMIIAQAQSQKAKRLLLAVYPENNRARRFYARHQFTEVGETLFMVGDVPFRDLIYARLL